MTKCISKPQNLFCALKSTKVNTSLCKLVFLFSLFLGVNNVAWSTDYYWIGGSGSWTDINKWSLSSGNSGGLKPATVPSSGDNVIFDEQSSLTASSIITVPEKAYCKDITFKCATKVNLSADLNIYGSAYLFLGVDFSGSNPSASVVFLSNQSEKIVSNGGKFPYIKVELGENGVLTLNDDLISTYYSGGGNITFTSGKFVTSGNKISALSFVSEGSLKRDLNIENSNIALSGYWEYSGTNATLAAINSLISTQGYKPNVNRVFWGIPGHQYYNISVQTNISGSKEGLYGGIIAHNLEVYSVNAFEISGNIDGTDILKNTFDNVILKSKVAFFNGIVKETITCKQTSLLVNSTIKEAFLENSVGISQISGCTIENLISKSSILFGDDKYTTNTIKDLNLFRNKTYTLNYYGSPKLTINGDISLEGSSCDGYVYFNSTLTNNTATIEKNGGDSHLSGVYAERIRVTSGTINVTDGIDGGGNTGNWNFSPISTSARYYRIGGGGEWYDPTKWSLSSGGPAENCVPRELDDVIFDNLSGLSPSDRTIKTSDMDMISCKNLRFEGTQDQNAPIFSTSKAYIRGSLLLQEKMSYTVPETNFIGSGSNSIKSNGVKITGGVNIDNESGVWSLEDNLNLTKTLLFVSGELNTNNNSITAENFESNINKPRILSLGSSSLYLKRLYRYQGDQASLLANTASIEINNSEYNTFFYGRQGHQYYNITMMGTAYAEYSQAISFYGGGVSVKNLVFKPTTNAINTCLVTYTGDNIIENLTSYSKVESFGGSSTIKTALFEEDAKITNNNTFEELIFGDAKNYTLANGTTQTVDVLSSKTTGCRGYMSLRSGGKAYIKSTGSNILLEGVTMNNIEGDISQGATYTAWGENEGNNPNWNFTPPVSKTLYWVGGGGNWNDPAHWSQTDGVPDGGCVPTKYDNVFFTSQSGIFSETSPIVIEGKDAVCKNMTWENDVKGNPVLKLSLLYPVYFNLNIYGSVILKEGMSISPNNAYNNQIKMYSEDNLLHSITTNKVKMPLISTETSGKWELNDNFTSLSNCDIYLKKGELDTKGFGITTASFNVQATAKLRLNSSVVTILSVMAIDGEIDGGTSHILFTTGSTLNTWNNKNNILYNVTFNGNGTINNSNYFFPSGKIEINKLIVGRKLSTVGQSAINTIKIKDAYWNGGAEVGNTPLSVDKLIIKNGFTYSFNSNSAPTIKTFETASADVCEGIAVIQSSSTQTVFNLTNPEMVKLRYVNLKGIKNTNGTITVEGDDLGNNVGWYFSPLSGRKLYWVGGEGNWNDPNHWSETSGGAPGVSCIPTMFDTVYFDKFSGFTSTNKKVNLTSGGVFVNTLIVEEMDNYHQFSGFYDINIYGSLFLRLGVTFNSSPPFRFKSTNVGNTIFSGGVSMPSFIYFEGTGSWELLDNLDCARSIYLTNGTLKTNGYNVKTADIIGNTMFNILDIRNSNITLTGTQMILSGNTKLFAGGSTVSFIGSGNVSITAPGGSAFGNIYVSNPRNTTIESSLNFVKAHFGGNLTLKQSCTFEELIVEQGQDRTITLTQGTTQTVKNNLQISGSPCRLTQIKSSVAGKSAKLQLENSFIQDFVRIQDIEVLNNTLTVERNSDNLGGNTNINFKPKTGEGLIGLAGDKHLCYKGFPYTLTTDGFFPGPPAEFTWRKDGPSGEIIGTNSTLIINESGTYWVSVNYKDAATNPCHRDDAITVSQAAPVTTPTYSIVRPNCHIDLVNLNVTAPLGTEYRYSLQPTGAAIDFKDEVNFSGLTAGKYDLVTKDADGCYSDTVLVEIAKPNKLGTANDITITSPQTICSGTTVVLAPTTTVGENPVFHWYEDSGLTKPITLGVNSTTGEFTTNTLSNDTTFYVTISSDTLCENLAGTAKEVFVNISPLLIPSANITPADCGVSNGRFTGTVTGGTAPLEYSINNINWSSSSTFSNLAPGTYTFYVKDAIGCIQSITIFIPSKVNNGGEISYSDALGYIKAEHEIKECIYLGSLNLAKVQSTWAPNEAADAALNDDGLNGGVVPNIGGYTDLNHEDFLLKNNGNLHIRLAASNFSEYKAYVRGWIDFGKDGVFDVADSSNKVIVNELTDKDSIELVWENAAPRMLNGPTYLRLRISGEDMGADKATGTMGNGEVEDYKLNFNLIHLTKTATVKHRLGGSANIGDTIVYTVNLVNLPQDEECEVVDFLPKHTTYVTGSADPTTDFNYLATERKLSWEVKNTSGNANLTFTFEAVVTGYPDKGDKIKNLAYGVYRNDSIPSDTAFVTINRLLAEDDCALTSKAKATIIDIRTNDTDPQRNIVITSIETEPEKGDVIILADGRLKYTPKPNSTGLDSIEYKISAPNTEARAWVRIAVVEINGMEACKNTTHSITVTPIDKVEFNWYSPKSNLIASSQNSLNVDVKTNDTIIYLEGSLFACTTNLLPLEIKVLKDKVYPDVRLQVCNDQNRSLNLSKYIDSSNFVSINWTSTSTVVSAQGEIMDISSLTPRVHRFNYAITHTCGIGKAVLYLRVGKQTFNEADTIVVCKDYADEINLNRVLGLDAADGSWVYSNEITHAKETMGAPYAGALIFDGKAAFLDTNLDKLPYKTTYKGADAREFEFEYQMSPDACFLINKRKLVIIVAETML